MRVVVGDEAEVVALAADAVIEALGRRADPVLGVATGSSPLALYRALAQRRGEVGSPTVFALDEYVGLGPDDARSYAAFVAEHVTTPLGLDPERVHVPAGDAEDLDAECSWYEADIADAGGVDVQVAGIGANGHLAFNEPGARFDSRTRVVALTEITRQANARFFAGFDEVPTLAVTQGIGTILAARRVVVLAFGEGKAEAVRRAIEGPLDVECPASALQLHPDVVWVLDPAAASALGGSSALSS